MHSSRMRTARSLTVSPYLIISPPRATTHAPRSNHACPPEQPCMPPRATMHAPRSNHTCPPRATTHTPPSNHTCPLEQPCMPPGATTHAPPEQPRRPPPRSNPPPGATTHGLFSLGTSWTCRAGKLLSIRNMCLVCVVNLYLTVLVTLDCVNLP